MLLFDLWLQKYVQAPNLAEYLGLRTVEALHMSVPLNAVFIGFKGEGNAKVGGLLQDSGVSMLRSQHRPEAAHCAVSRKQTPYSTWTRQQAVCAQVWSHGLSWPRCRAGHVSVKAAVARLWRVCRDVLCSVDACRSKCLTRS